MELADFGTYEFDHVTGERSFSPELRKIFGLGPHTRLTGDQLVNYVHPEDRERVTATIPIARDPKGAGRNAFECRVVRSDGDEIGRAHVLTPVTNAHIVCSLLLEKKNPLSNHIINYTI